MNLTKALDLTSVVTRSLWLLAVSTAIVILFVAFSPPQAAPHGSVGHSGSLLDDRPAEHDGGH